MSVCWVFNVTPFSSLIFELFVASVQTNFWFRWIIWVCANCGTGTSLRFFDTSIHRDCRLVVGAARSLWTPRPGENSFFIPKQIQRVDERPVLVIVPFYHLIICSFLVCAGDFFKKYKIYTLLKNLLQVFLVQCGVRGWYCQRGELQRQFIQRQIQKGVKGKVES